MLDVTRNSLIFLRCYVRVSYGHIRSILIAVTAFHLGEHLAEELKALDMSAAELARKLDVPTNRITQILNGTRARI